MRSKTDEFEVLVPSTITHGLVERVRVQIPLEWDSERQTWMLGEEAHRIIEATRARYFAKRSEEPAALQS
ncbi:hypothetical protein DB346_16780 [Verrucomicrobia bacterium LW23]|nr:hypothetical protein DB346_16780 [Verrucomicrobia bacterium LW23]